MAGFDAYFLFGLLSLIVSTITVVGHSLILVAFHQIRSLTTNPSNRLIQALSVCDLSFGVFVFINYGIPITFGLDNPYGEIGCLISYLVDITAYLAGNLLLVAITLDRVQLVSMEYSQYMKSQNKSKISKIIGGCFAVGMTNAIIETGFWNYAKRNNEAAANIDFSQYCAYPPRRMSWFSIYTFLMYVTPVITVGVLSVVFLFLLRKRLQKSTRIGNDSSSRSDATGPDGNTGDKVGKTDGEEEEKGDVVRKRYLKPAITLGALVAAMALSMLPYCMYLTIESFTSKTLNYNLMYFMWLIYELNPFLDSVFYTATQKTIKEYYWKKFVKMCKVCFPGVKV